ncbi:SulP family inorganic anion transporter [Rhodococcus sp. H36-A4]|uniref:SulP family inorganic anion transporter n=1 Tax=Rhodococcus sp. H36-A4 TaxID=3004353 RepID=UPI0022AED341|nr:SulP family inorganic anion transporter [Rhodococcus sp. H36-A4]MCZ4077259.1 SulP family inorganic anion transporter [Rhodococcus sp. H36-A4]
MHPKSALGVRLRGARSMLFSSLQGYRSAWLAGDLAAGLTLLSIAVPEQLATARLAGMPPITGFYAFFAGTLLFALLGSNRQMSIGADSTIAPLFAVGVATAVSTVPGDYVALVGILAVMVGVIVALVGLLRLGWIAEFLSTPIIAGFLGGVAVIIVVHQLPDLLGLPAGSGGTLNRIGTIVSESTEANGWTLGIGVGVFVVVFLTDKWDRRLPGALIALVGSTILVSVFDLTSHGVAVLGSLAHGAPHLGLHGVSWSALSALAPTAGVVALVIVSQSAATTRAFAADGGYGVDVDRDFFGIGAGNVVAGLVGAFPVNASPPRTAAVVSASGRTQVAGIAAVAALLLLIPALALLENLPVATLAAILIFIATRIVHVRELIDIARYDRFEFALAVVTLLTVALVGVEYGIGVAVALAILDRTRLSARPHLHVLGHIPSTTSWVPLSYAEQARTVPGVLVVQFATPLWYANATEFRTEITATIDAADHPLHLVVLDTMGMTDIDYTGAHSLRQLIDQLRSRGVTFAMARTSKTARRGLARSGLLAQIGQEHMFSSVGEAIGADVGTEDPDRFKAKRAGSKDEYNTDQRDPNGP